MKKKLKRLLTGMLTLATVFIALPASPVHASGTQYWTDGEEKAGYVEKVMNDGSIGSTFHESIMTVEGETAYCVDINTDFQSGYKVRSDASSRMSADQIADVALSLEYVKQYGASHKGLNHKQLWAKLAVGNAKLQKVSSNTSVTNGSDVYSLAGAVYGVFSDKDCKNAVATLTTDSNGNTDAVEVKAGDLVFFHSTYNSGSYVSHVGIYVGNNQMYHAGDPIGYADLTSSCWQQHLIGAGRIKQ